MQSDSYIVIQGFMCNEMGLKGNDLLVYALIYGFSQDGKSKFFGGRRYIAETFNISLPTVDKALQNLIDRDLIIKEPCRNQAETDSYCVNISSKESLVVKKLYHGSKETLPNNIDITKDKNSTKVELGEPKRRHLITTDIPNVPAKKKSRYEQCIEVTESMFSDTGLRKILADYLSMRLAIKDKPMYVSGWKALLNKLKGMSGDVNELIKIVSQSLENSWATFYELKGSYRNGVDKFGECGQVFSKRTSEADRVDVYF